MPPFNDPSDFPHDFIKRMDAGEFDGKLSDELAKLSKEQLEEVARALRELGREPRFRT